MSEESFDDRFGADPTDPLAQASFEGPAIHADRVLVTERGNIVRIAVAESDMSGDPHFRGAIAVSLDFADELSTILRQVVINARTRSEGN